MVPGKELYRKIIRGLRRPFDRGEKNLSVFAQKTQIIRCKVRQRGFDDRCWGRGQRRSFHSLIIQQEKEESLRCTGNVKKCAGIVRGCTGNCKVVYRRGKRGVLKPVIHLSLEPFAKLSQHLPQGRLRLGRSCWIREETRLTTPSLPVINQHLSFSHLLFRCFF